MSSLTAPPGPVKCPEGRARPLVRPAASGGGQRGWVARAAGVESLGRETEPATRDYAHDAVFITPDGVRRGKSGVREGFEKLLADVPSAEWEVPTQTFEDDLLFIEWKATAANTRVEDGIDTFLFRDGLIRAQDGPLHGSLIGAAGIILGL